jgi:co-chaperonin GroES (HSP10)
MSVPFRPLGDRVVIQADVEDHAPQQTESGLITAKTLAAAVEGSDTEDSWFVGTVVAIGPKVNRFDVRAYLNRKFHELEVPPWGDDISAVAKNLYRWVKALRAEFLALPTDCPDPVQVGDRVTFSWASGQQITVDGTKYLIMRQGDLLAVLDPESEAVA